MCKNNRCGRPSRSVRKDHSMRQSAKGLPTAERCYQDRSTGPAQARTPRDGCARKQRIISINEWKRREKSGSVPVFPFFPPIRQDHVVGRTGNEGTAGKDMQSPNRTLLAPSPISDLPLNERMSESRHGSKRTGLSSNICGRCRES